MSEEQSQSTVTIYLADLASGTSGRVEAIEELTEQDAVAALSFGKDIVVCGPDQSQNKKKARELMQAAYGGYEYHTPHTGKFCLPHYHPPRFDPDGVHAFYETDHRYAHWPGRRGR